MQIEISEHAWAYLQQLAEPFVDTPSSVLDRIVNEHQLGSVSADRQNEAPILSLGAPREFTKAKLPLVTFTDLTNAKIQGAYSKERSWNHVMSDVVAKCIETGVDRNELLGRLFLNYEEGVLELSGYYPVPSANITLKGASAKRILKQIVDLSSTFDLTVELEWSWQPKSDALFPGQSGRLVLP